MVTKTFQMQCGASKWGSHKSDGTYVEGFMLILVLELP
jgi:hypothetical protein